MEIPADIAAQAAMTRQNIALSVIKQNAEAEKAIVNILDQSLSVGPAARGSNVSLSA
jgi:hypothetical protein